MLRKILKKRLRRRTYVMQNRGMDSLRLDALKRAIGVVGTATGLARRLALADNAPAMWIARGNVPAEHCPDIERETGVRCEELRPDVSWYVLRGKPARPARMKARKAAEGRYEAPLLAWVHRLR